jgi:hypothetical protein
VAFYTACHLVQEWTPGTIFYDPAAGKGSLLIACGVCLALNCGLRDESLLETLHGGEICPDTRQTAIETLRQALTPWTPTLTPEQAAEIIAQNIRCADFFNSAVPPRSIVISNPPYKEEGAAGNLWIRFAQKILATADLSGVGLIVPVSICSARRTRSIRQSLISQFSRIQALHHEIRPRPLFRNVEQRITILVATRTGTQEYVTTGFLTHRAGERDRVWSAPLTSLPLPALHDVFPKVGEGDVDFFRGQIAAARRLADFLSTRPEDTIWVRSTGRYSLCAQKGVPGDLTTKWHAVRLTPPGQTALLESFQNGDALRWWRIFGDGRDLSITQFIQRFGVS